MKQPYRVAIIGAASSGKTTLAQALAQRYGAVWVPEYLREFCDTRQSVPVSTDQFHIATTQVAREDALAAQGGRFLFCDTTPLMTAVYSIHYFGGTTSAASTSSSKASHRRANTTLLWSASLNLHGYLTAFITKSRMSAVLLMRSCSANWPGAAYLTRASRASSKSD
jgi:nicotinamide riboside kinase